MKTLLTITVGYLLSYLWLILPSKMLKGPFPLFTMEINIRYYADYLMARFFYFVLAWVIYTQHKTVETKVVLWLFLLFIVDFILIYNQPYGYFSGGSFTKVKPESGFYIPLSYSLFMGISLIFLTVIAWIKY